MEKVSFSSITIVTSVSVSAIDDYSKKIKDYSLLISSVWQEQIEIGQHIIKRISLEKSKRCEQVEAFVDHFWSIYTVFMNHS